jgi:hypothetical protein
MSYGWGVGFVRSASSNPIRSLRASGSASAVGTYNIPFKIIGTTTNYQVPAGKTFLIALTRRVAITGNIQSTEIGYADDANGTNYVSLFTLSEADLTADNTERYYIFSVPATKFPIFRFNISTAGASNFVIIIVGFEV